MPENPMTNQEKLHALRAEIAKAGLDGFILPRTDEFQGENLAPYAERLKWLSGFTGSAGVAVILKDKAIVMSDGRYTIQLRQQVDGALYTVGNSVETPAGEWIAAQTSEGAKIGYDPWLYTPKQLESLQKQMGERVLVAVHNPVDAVWAGRPEKPQASVVAFPDAVAGKSSAEKRGMLAEVIKKQKANAAVLTQADSICWLLNVRGGDVEYSPLVHSFAVLNEDATLDWFIEARKVAGLKLDEGVRIRKPDDLKMLLEALEGQNVLLDRGSAPVWFENILKGQSVKIIDYKDLCVQPKAIKTQAEQSAIKKVHVRDGVAMVKFLMWLEHEAPKGKQSEISVAEKLEEFRGADPDYRGPSFPTIAGFNENGAIVHYRASEETNKMISSSGLLLLDSGGQYADGGTTDITRTIAIGKPRSEIAENYTRVLKGHIALARAQFPSGTTGAQIDTLARQPLWEAGLDYAHGTGHGVGCYLGVHEEAANISPRGDKALQAGMLLSNEPGYYKEGAYGIRIENLVFVVEKGFCPDTKKTMLGFETVTLVPYDRSLIVSKHLEAGEKAWLNAYLHDVFVALSPFLSKDEVRWLKKQTVPF